MTINPPPKPPLAVNPPVLTWSDFDDHHPCYDPLKQYGDWSGTILDLLRREDIPAGDRLWALSREGVLDARLQRLCAVAFVRETPLGDGRFVADLLTDERSAHALTVAESYAYERAGDRELDAARIAAKAATKAATKAVARIAAKAAARVVAKAAARPIARSVATAVATGAATDAATDAAWKAVRASTEAAAEAVAQDVAEAAAWYAAWYAARAAARDAQVQIAIRVINYHTAV